MKRIKKGLKYTLMFSGLLFLLLLAVLFATMSFFPESSISQRIVNAIHSQQEEKQQEVSQDIYIAFRTTLQNEVKQKIGMPIEGYVPFMFLDVFPGLTETDFEGVEASIGHYTVEGGRLIHKLDNSRLIHSAATAITDRGMDQLLLNVSSRLKVDLASGGTLTKIMDALVYKDTTPSTPPVACTLDAKICPDGSAVGRVGPSCEFAPCP